MLRECLIGIHALIDPDMILQVETLDCICTIIGGEYFSLRCWLEAMTAGRTRLMEFEPFIMG